jgi:adenosylcobinamide amidohydrolase
VRARPRLRVATHVVDDRAFPVLAWQLHPPRLVLSSAAVGGGIGERCWVLNAQVPRDYRRVDLDDHVGEIAASAGCRGTGVGMLTAVDVRDVVAARDGDVHACATVGVTLPTWAAAPDRAKGPPAGGPGTINVVVFLPVRLSEAALVNAATTATEAKAQALAEAGVPGTGTASDAVTICCARGGELVAFGGPRSEWGARLARSVHSAVADGLTRGSR